MSSSEQLAIIQSKFTSGETVVIATEAPLIQGWLRAARILALVSKGSTHALVILLTSRTPPRVFSDLTIERVLPVDQDFKCDINTDKKQPDGLDVFLNVASRKLQLVFEMKPGEATSALVSEIFRAFDDYQKSKNPPTEYLWIQKLTGSSRNLESSPNDTQDGSDPNEGIGSPTCPSNMFRGKGHVREETKKSEIS